MGTMIKMGRQVVSIAGVCVVKISSKIRVGLIASVLCSYVAPIAMAQAASGNEQAYHVLLQKIADEKIRIAQKQVFVAGAKAQIADLNAQIDGLDAVKVSVRPYARQNGRWHCP